MIHLLNFCRAHSSLANAKVFSSRKARDENFPLRRLCFFPFLIDTMMDGWMDSRWSSLLRCHSYLVWFSACRPLFSRLLQRRRRRRRLPPSCGWFDAAQFPSYFLAHMLAKRSPWVVVALVSWAREKECEQRKKAEGKKDNHYRSILITLVLCDGEREEEADRGQGIPQSWSIHCSSS